MQEKVESLIKLYCRQKQLQKLLMRIVQNRFLKFCFVGGISTILNYGFFFLFFILGIYYLIAAAAGYIIGVFAGFLMNKHFTFQSSAKSYTIEITKYLMVYATSLLLALGLLRILVFFGMHATLAYIATIVVTTITNFLGCKLFVFNHSLWITKVNFLIYRHKYLIRYMTIGVSAVFLEIFMIEVLTLAQ